MASMGTIESESAVASFMGLFNRIRNKGTITIPPPSPDKETVIPANIPIVMVFQTFSFMADVGSNGLGLFDFPHIILAMEISKKPRKTHWKSDL